MRALKSAEDLAALYDPRCAGPKSKPVPPDLAGPQVQRRLVSLALCDAQGRPQLTQALCGRLETTELASLAADVLATLDRLSPACWRADIDAWRKALEKGADHFTNTNTMIAMAETGGWNQGAQRAADRYYGTATANLTDGQRLGFEAACNVYARLMAKG